MYREVLCIAFSICKPISHATTEQHPVKNMTLVQSIEIIQVLYYTHTIYVCVFVCVALCNFVTCENCDYCHNQDTQLYRHHKTPLCSLFMAYSSPPLFLLPDNHYSVLHF